MTLDQLRVVADALAARADKLEGEARELRSLTDSLKKELAWERLEQIYAAMKDDPAPRSLPVDSK